MVKRLAGAMAPSRPDLRLALVEAAERVIDRDGFGALRARALTEAAGCALGALYTAFADMDALVAAVKLRILDRLEARLDAAEGVGDAVPLALARGYVDFAFEERRRWEVLFQHHPPAGAEIPQDYAIRLAALFARVAGPLRLLRPDLDGAAAQRLAETLFAAVHGIVALGLEGKLGPLGRDEIRARVEWVVRAALADLRGAPQRVTSAQARNNRP